MQGDSELSASEVQPNVISTLFSWKVNSTSISAVFYVSCG